MRDLLVELTREEIVIEPGMEEILPYFSETSRVWSLTNTYGTCLT